MNEITGERLLAYLQSLTPEQLKFYVCVEHEGTYYDVARGGCDILCINDGTEEEGEPNCIAISSIT